MIDEFQREQVLKLKENNQAYKDASIYTILLDLVENNSANEVKLVLDQVILDSVS